MRYAILFLGLVLLACRCKPAYSSQEDTSSATLAVPVKAVPLQLTEEPIAIEASGTVASREVIGLSFKVGGIVERTYAREGQWVNAGQLLAKLKTTEIDAQVLKARQAADKAGRDVKRIERLYADTAATLEQVQDLNTALELALADLEIARFNQEYAEIKAPVSGRVIRESSEAGELVSPGRPVYTLAANGQKGYVIRIGIADKDLVRLRMGDRAEVQFDAHPGQAVPAFVSEIAEAAGPRTGTFEVELALQPGKLEIRNGFIGKARIFPSRQAPYFRIAMDALVEGYEHKAHLYLAMPDSMRARQVKVEPQYIGPAFFTIDTSQLESDALVITAGAAYLSDGARIELVEEVSDSVTPQ